MYISLHGLISKSIVVYLDDVIVLSKKICDHLTNLWHIFDKCCKYGISLNQKKKIFIVTKENILGYIISKDTIFVDPKLTQAITSIIYYNKKKMPCNLSWEDQFCP